MADLDKSKTNDTKVLVIGGGPAGTTVATFLAKAGVQVRLLEKERFPRFHIGESLLPYNQPIFHDLGILPELERAGFPRKLGVQFHLSNGSKKIEFLFRDGRYTKEPNAFQVERSKFDQILLENAKSNGVEVCEGTTVTAVSQTADEVLVKAKSDTGESSEWSADYLVDASGQASFTGVQEGTRQFHETLKKVSIFGHFKNVTLSEGDHAGDTVIVRDRERWFWLIPIGENKISVGVVVDKTELTESNLEPSELFHESIKTSSVMRDRMQSAVATMPLKTSGNFSYSNDSLVNGRILRVGDAAGFIDPIFSSGVYLAMRSGRKAAEAITRVIQHSENHTQPFLQYEKNFRRSFDFYLKMVEQFYTMPFMEIFMEPRDFLRIPDAVNAVLAGELADSFSLKWRMWLFFRLVKRQAKHSIVPRISFD